MIRDIDVVTEAYVACAIWADADEGAVGEPSPAMVAQAKEDCIHFIGLLDGDEVDSSEWSDEEFGHDLWLTRKRHGAGFWDRGRKNGEELTKWAHTMGSRDIYLGDDGLFYF